MQRECCLSGHNAEISFVSGTGSEMLHVECPACGKYFISDSAAVGVANVVGARLYVLIGVVREAADRGAPVTIETSNTEQLLDSASIPNDPIEAMDRILLYVQRKLVSPDQAVYLSARNDFPIVYAKVPEEFDFYLEKLVQLGYLESRTSGYFLLSISGWRHILELRKTERDSNQVFVAVSFDKTLDPVWKNGFKNALDETGYRPIRVDLVEHNEKICDRIIAEIRRSGLVVADFTQHKGGVYFEVGFAMGLGIPVIWTCRDTDIEKAHFDTRQYNHIVWTNYHDLKKKLVDRIEATLPSRRKRTSQRG